MDITEKRLKELYEAAVNASKKSYSPYSNFPVGAAILLPDDTIVSGTNIENRSYGLTNCAERTAVFTAAASGWRSFCALAIATPESDYPVGPCGACRQVLSEFAPADIPVLFGPKWENITRTTLGALYPYDSLHELAKYNEN